MRHGWDRDGDVMKIATLLCTIYIHLYCVMMSCVCLMDFNGIWSYHVIPSITFLLGKHHSCGYEMFHDAVVLKP